MKFVVDIDGTLLYSNYVSGEYDLYGRNEDLIKKINSLYYEGHEIILQTGRHWNDLLLTKKQLEKNGIKYHTLVCGKPIGDFYIDDRAILPHEFLKEEI